MFRTVALLVSLSFVASCGLSGPYPNSFAFAEAIEPYCEPVVNSQQPVVQTCNAIVVSKYSNDLVTMVYGFDHNDYRADVAQRSEPDYEGRDMMLDGSVPAHWIYDPAYNRILGPQDPGYVETNHRFLHDLRPVK